MYKKLIIAFLLGLPPSISVADKLMDVSLEKAIWISLETVHGGVNDPYPNCNKQSIKDCLSDRIDGLLLIHNVSTKLENISQKNSSGVGFYYQICSESGNCVQSSSLANTFKYLKILNFENCDSCLHSFISINEFEKIGYRAECKQGESFKLKYELEKSIYMTFSKPKRSNNIVYNVPCSSKPERMFIANRNPETLKFTSGVLYEIN